MQQLWRTFGNALPLALILVVLGALIAWAVASRRARSSPRKQAWVSAILDVILVLSVLVVLYLVLIPIPGLANRSMISLTPGSEIGTLFGAKGSTPAQSAAFQILGNLLMFVPMGALAPLRMRWCRSLVTVTIAALAVSVVIEVLQAVLHVGRVSATDDVILNTLGALLGAWITMRWWRGPVAAIDQASGRVAVTQ
ncbi:VanZ family protein [Amycolatopsis rhabdoformis]|uniref:VanZ family protein n=1 Tax=Amycolatopsis rhabdoformis TaxID=1448059 RepID=A0ABZ1I9P5_9PSEU|nr:VanZ family protein [Amycolatopsis rhabdoformis]WSE31137.1 VanZ family protein [Amycolatopsis rhabdoformis]